jgi:hypothetical protein
MTTSVSPLTADNLTMVDLIGLAGRFQGETVAWQAEVESLSVSA